MNIKSFKTFMSEARRNPEQNPKVSAYEHLKPYANDPDVYISFTDIDKLGVNPKSQFNTPLGLYFYPLQEVWDFYDIDRTKSLTVLPFAADRPWIWIVRAKSVGDSFVDNLYSDYGSNNYDDDIITLKKVWDEEAPKVKTLFISYDFEADYEEALKKIKYYEELLKDFDDMPEFSEEDITYKKVTKPKYEYRLKQAKHNLTGLELERERHIITKMWNELVEFALYNARIKSSVSSFWNLTRLMASRLSGGKKGLPMATKWNWLLRKCGYTGFADKSGKGIIHMSEPIQAVFLTRQAFDVIDKIQNKDYIGRGIRTLEDINQELKEHTKIGYIVDTISYLSGDRNDPLLKITDTADNIISGADYWSFKGFLYLVLKYADASNSVIGINELFYKRLQKIHSKYMATHHTSPSEFAMFNQTMIKIKDHMTK